MIRVKILTIPNQRKISTICAEYTDHYRQENELTAEIISAIKQPIAGLIESNIVLDDFHEVTDEQYNTLRRWIALNNESYCDEHYILIVDKFSKSKSDFINLLDLASSKLAKHDAQIKKEQEENERQRLKAATAAEKRRLKKQQAEEYIIEKNKQKEINMLLTSLSDELGKSVTLDDIKALIKTKS